jgi:hypothetical protein
MKLNFARQQLKEAMRELDLVEFELNGGCRW